MTSAPVSLGEQARAPGFQERGIPRPTRVPPEREKLIQPSRLKLGPANGHSLCSSAPTFGQPEEANSLGAWSPETSSGVRGWKSAPSGSKPQTMPKTTSRGVSASPLPGLRLGVSKPSCTSSSPPGSAAMAGLWDTSVMSQTSFITARAGVPGGGIFRPPTTAPKTDVGVSNDICVQEG